MKAITLSEVGAAPKISDNIEIPEPGEGEILVKVLYTAINPVDADMAAAGYLVESWPFIPGCDVSGVIVKTGLNATNALGKPFNKGDELFGCTRVGFKPYTAWCEYLLMDAPLAIPRPSNISLAQASASGVGILTASLGVFQGLKVPYPKPSALSNPVDEWALVFGGAGSVGQFAVQLLKISGYKVVTTCSTKSAELLLSLGADRIVDYKKPKQEIIDEVKSITGGRLSLAFDAVSVNNSLLVALFGALASASEGTTRLYTTTNDWDPIPVSTAANSFEVHLIQLGPIGRPEAKDLNKRLGEIVPVVYELFSNGKLKPSELSVEGEGIEAIPKAWEIQKSGTKGSTKVVVKVAA